MLQSKNILLVDDHPLILSGVSVLLEHAGAKVSTAKTLDEAGTLLSTQKFDLTLLDINMGVGQGLELITDTFREHLGRIVLFSGVTEQEFIFRGYSLGAIGFVSKNTEPSELLQALTCIVDTLPPEDAGWVWCPQRHALVESNHYFSRESLLTAKEREVFMLLREGLPDKQIADALSLSVHTVRVHIRAIKRKRGHNRRFEQHV